ncbi:hypothetical protein [Methanochimaera problematica]|nr:hypothetical protein [Methanoplanus sp. FWC-SCC4]
MALLGAVFVPVVSAEEIKTTNETTGISIYEILELKEPIITKGSQWQSYNQNSENAVKLISLSGLKIENDQIIGYIEGENEKALLYKTGEDNYYIILEDNGIISIDKAELKDLGSKIITSPVKGGLPETTTEYLLKEISLSNTKSKEFSSKSVYSATITRTDRWVYLGYTSATLYTKGTFTYDYGNQILGISDSSYTSQDVGFAKCSFDHSTRITGITGYVEADVIWSVYSVSPPKHSVDAWISCNYYGTTGGDSNHSDWVAVGGLGCLALP